MTGRQDAEIVWASYALRFMSGDWPMTMGAVFAGFGVPVGAATAALNRGQTGKGQDKRHKKCDGFEAPECGMRFGAATASKGEVPSRCV